MMGSGTFTVTPLPMLAEVNLALEVLGMMRAACAGHYAYLDAAMGAELAAGLDAVSRWRGVMAGELYEA